MIGPCPAGVFGYPYADGETDEDVQNLRSSKAAPRVPALSPIDGRAQERVQGLHETISTGVAGEERRQSLDEGSGTF